MEYTGITVFCVALIGLLVVAMFATWVINSNDK